MRALTDVWRRLRSLGRRAEIEDGLEDEIRFHVEQQIEKNRRAGMTPYEARRKALIGDAPRPWAACSSVGSSPSSDAEMTTSA